MTDDAAPIPPRGYGPALVLVGAIAVLAALLAVLPQAPGALVFAFVIAAWIASVVVHEFGHAWVAWLAGDHTVEAKGYLSLEPRRYGDLGTTLVVPLIALALGGIGFPGGAVYLRQDLMRSPLWRAAASLAGPAGTLLVLVSLAGLVFIAGGLLGPASALTEALAFLAFLQATALILNLLPIPGLDGYGAIRPFLPEAWAKALRPVEGLAIVILLLLIFFVPGVSSALFRTAVQLVDLFGIPVPALAAGYDAFQFWR